MKNLRQRCRGAAAERGRRGFTLIEALAAIGVMMIVIPVLLRGFSIAGSIATNARRRAEATAMAQSKMDEIIATQSWQTGMAAGDEKVGIYSYHYEPALENWDSGEVGIQVLRVTVSWDVPPADRRNVALTTLLWQPGSTIQTSSSNGRLSGGALP